MLPAVTGQDFRARDGGLNALLLQVRHPSLGTRITFNPVAWPLSCEVLLYFLFPFLVRLVDQVPQRLWLWTALPAASVIFLPALAELLRGDRAVVPGDLQARRTARHEAFRHVPPQLTAALARGLKSTGRDVPDGSGGADQATNRPSWGGRPRADHRPDRAKEMRFSMSNPFEDPDALYLVLVNAEGQHSLWPADAAVPAGWSTAHEADSREHCLQYVEEQWTDMRPHSLVRAERA